MKDYLKKLITRKKEDSRHGNLLFSDLFNTIRSDRLIQLLQSLLLHTEHSSEAVLQQRRNEPVCL